MARGKATVSTKEKTETQGPPPDSSQALSAAIALMDEEFKELKLEGKIATISGWLDRVPKNGYNNYNNYPYVLESDLVEHIRYWLAAARILIYQHVKEWRVTDTAASERRAGDPRTDVLYTFRVVDGRTGENFQFDMLGQGSDPRDKGSNKASTSAMKFAYLRLFNIASGEDAEKDEAGERQAALNASAPVVPMTAPGQQRPAAAPAAAPAATPTVSAGGSTEVQRGGVQSKASGAQITAVSNLSNQLGLGGPGLVAVIKKELGDDIELPDDEKEHGKVLAAYLKAQEGQEVGKLIYRLQELVRAMPDPGAPGYGD